MDVRSRRLAAFVFSIALLTNFGYLALLHDELTSDDSPTYLGPARQLVAGRGFANMYGLPETRRTPGYALLLAPFVNLPHGLMIVAVVQHVINAGLAVAVFWFSLSLFGDVVAAFMGGIFFAFDVPSLHHANQILTETSFTALILATAALLFHRKYALAALIAGASVLIRPIALYLFVPMAIFAALDVARRRVLVAAVVVICFAIAPLGWALRNERVAGQMTVSTITAWSLLFDRAAATLAVTGAAPGGSSVLRWRDELAREAGDSMPATYSNHIERSIDHFHTDRWTAIALRQLLRHPLAYGKAHSLAILRLMLGGGAQTLHDRLHVPLSAGRAAVAAYNAVAIVLMIIGMVVAWRTSRRAAIVLLIFIAYALATTSVAEATSRFRVPITPMLAITVGLGAHAVAERRGRAGAWRA